MVAIHEQTCINQVSYMALAIQVLCCDQLSPLVWHEVWCEVGRIIKLVPWPPGQTVHGHPWTDSGKFEILMYSLCRMNVFKTYVVSIKDFHLCTMWCRRMTKFATNLL